MHRVTPLILLVGLGLCPGCFEKTPNEDALVCKPGFSMVCYSGPEGTRDVGVCVAGLSLCVEENGEYEESCFAEVLPSDELCDGLDNDCDGWTDEDGACALENLDKLQQLVGDLGTIFDNDRVGPALVFHKQWGSIFQCSGKSAGECADGFLQEYGPTWGIVDEAQAFENLGVVDVLGTHVVQYRQLLHGLPVIGGACTIVIAGDSVSSVQAKAMPSPSAEKPVPVLSQDEAMALLPEGNKGVVSHGLVYHVGLKPIDDSAKVQPAKLERYMTELAYDFTYASGLGPQRAYVGAMTGSLLRVQPLLINEISPEMTWYSGTSLVDPQAEGGNYPDAIAWERDFVDYLNYQDVLPDAPEIRKHGIHLNVGTDSVVEPGSVSNSCKSGSIAFHVPMSNDYYGDIYGIPGHSYVCAGEYSARNIIHETNHWLLDAYFGCNHYVTGYYTSDDDRRAGYDPDHREHNSVIESFAMVGTEVFLCYLSKLSDGVSGDCDYIHNGFSFIDIYSVDNMHNEPTPETQDDKQLQKYLDARVIGSGIYRFFDSITVVSSETAAYKVALIYLFSLPLMPKVEGVEVEFDDFYLKLQVACSSLAHSGRTFTAGDSGLTFGVLPEDCLLLNKAFVTVGVADECDFQFPEVCNGLDDDCDGFRDECGEYDDCCEPIELVNAVTPGVFPGACEVQQRAAKDDTLTRYCFEGEVPGTDGIGVCHGGYQTCVSGAWTPCVGSVIVTPEDYARDEDEIAGACSGIGANRDNNCNGSIDEGCICNPDVKPAMTCGGEQLIPESAPHCSDGIQLCLWDETDHTFRWDEHCFGSQWGHWEICDGFDNDCNGKIDDQPMDAHDPEQGPFDPLDPDQTYVVCTASGALGWCATQAHWECQNGQRICVQGNPTSEACDFEDRDCNGIPGVYDIAASTSGPLPQACQDILNVSGGPGGVSGCAAGPGPLHDVIQVPLTFLAACPGDWQSIDSDASDLCAPDWHVCNGHDKVLESLSGLWENAIPPQGAYAANVGNYLSGTWCEWVADPYDHECTDQVGLLCFGDSCDEDHSCGYNGTSEYKEPYNQGFCGENAVCGGVLCCSNIGPQVECECSYYVSGSHQTHVTANCFDVPHLWL